MFVVLDRGGETPPNPGGPVVPDDVNPPSYSEAINPNGTQNYYNEGIFLLFLT